ncbi:MAG: hypothetical protein V1870_01530 [Candidatus Aenigmatarchaeota archaeon]
MLTSSKNVISYDMGEIRLVINRCRNGDSITPSEFDIVFSYLRILPTKPEILSSYPLSPQAINDYRITTIQDIAKSPFFYISSGNGHLGELEELYDSILTTEEKRYGANGIREAGNTFKKIKEQKVAQLSELESTSIESDRKGFWNLFGLFNSKK